MTQRRGGRGQLMGKGSEKARMTLETNLHCAGSLGKKGMLSNCFQISCKVKCQGQAEPVQKCTLGIGSFTIADS